MRASVGNNQLLVGRNSQQNLQYYEDLVSFFEADGSDTLMKLRSFALYTPRQVLSDFLVRYELFKQVLEIPGSIVECGVLNGQGLLTFAQCSAILEPNNVNRLVFGLDTFSGFPSVSDADRSGASDRMVAGGMKVDGSLERIQQAMTLFDQNRFIGHVPKIKLWQGDIVAQMDKFLEEHPYLLISLLYLDVDLYEPTKVILERLLPRVPKGGLVVFDELNMKDYPGETQALMHTLDISKLELKRLPHCSRISYFVR